MIRNFKMLDVGTPNAAATHFRIAARRCASESADKSEVKRSADLTTSRTSTATSGNGAGASTGASQSPQPTGQDRSNSSIPTGE